MIFSKKEKQFREAYADYYPLVYNTTYSRVKSVDDAEDICHEIFIDFYNKLENIEDKRKWLINAIRYGILNYYKKKNTTPVDISTLENDINLSFENGARDIRIIINEVIDDIQTYGNEKEKTIFELIAKNNYTHEETAELVGLSKRQVKYLYGKASQAILSVLQTRGIRDIEDIL